MTAKDLAKLPVCILVGALLTGCIGPTSPGEPPPDSMVALSSVLQVDSADSWRAAPRDLPVRAGDTFGALWLEFFPGDEDAFLQEKVYGLTIDTSGLGPDSFYALTAYRVESGIADWRVTTFGRGEEKAAIGVSAENGPAAILFVFIGHVPSGGVLRAAATAGFPAELPTGPASTGTWLVSGPASISDYLVSGPTSDAGQPVREAFAYGVEVESVVPPTSLVSAPNLVLRTNHPGTAASVEFSTTTVLGAAGVGWEEVAWVSAGKTNAASSPFLSAGVSGMAAGHLALGFQQGETRLESRVVGGAAAPFIHLSHLSVPLDLARWNLDQPSRFQVNSPFISQSNDTLCYVAAGDAVCSGVSVR